MKLSAVIVAALALTACKGKHAAQRKQANADKAQTGATATGPAAIGSALEPPDVHGPGIDAVTKLSATISYGGSSLRVGTQPICDVHPDSSMDPSCVERLTRVLENQVRGDDPIGLALDKNLLCFRVTTLLSQLEAAGFRSFALLVGEGKTMIPLMTPDPGQQSGLRIVVTVNTGSVALWSLSGQEGTRARPKLQAPITPELKPLTDALAEIVHRRWPTGARPAEERSITLEVDHMLTVEALYRVIAAVRASDRGELFPVIQLSGGF